MFTIYSTADCSYCKAAKSLLASRHQTYEELDVMENAEAYEFFLEQRFRTVPQIYHNGVHIGGFDDLKDYMERDNHEG